jgi:hypothetical protein
MIAVLLIGCTSRQPEEGVDNAQHEKGAIDLTSSSAQRALFVLLSDPTFGGFTRNGAFLESLRIAQRPDDLDWLDQIIEYPNGDISIGGWMCNLKKREFSRWFEFGSYGQNIRGKFSQDNSGNWIAEISGIEAISIMR